MRNVVYAFMLWSILGCNQSKEEQPDKTATYYLLRHAQTNTDNPIDPALSAVGEQQAAHWVNYFFLKEVNHILSSDFIRTRSTAQPLAKAKNVSVEIYDVFALHADSLKRKFPHKDVVVIGHSNTINELANQFQKDTIYPPLAHDDYTHYFKVLYDGKNTSVTQEVITRVN